MPLSALRRRGSSVFACVLVTSIALASPAHQQQPPPPDEDKADSKCAKPKYTKDR